MFVKIDNNFKPNDFNKDAKVIDLKTGGKPNELMEQKVSDLQVPFAQVIIDVVENYPEWNGADAEPLKFDEYSHWKLNDPRLAQVAGKTLLEVLAKEDHTFLDIRSAIMEWVGKCYGSQELYNPSWNIELLAVAVYKKLIGE